MVGVLGGSHASKKDVTKHTQYLLNLAEQVVVDIQAMFMHLCTEKCYLSVSQLFYKHKQFLLRVTAMVLGITVRPVHERAGV